MGGFCNFFFSAGNSIALWRNFVDSMIDVGMICSYDMECFGKVWLQLQTSKNVNCFGGKATSMQNRLRSGIWASAVRGDRCLRN